MRVAILALVALAAVATGVALADTAYASLFAPNQAGNTTSPYSQSILHRTSGVGFGRYGWIYQGFYHAHGCNVDDCRRNAGDETPDPIPPSILECDDETGTAVWLCEHPG
jgi:hypothetical protein